MNSFVGVAAAAAAVVVVLAAVVDDVARLLSEILLVVIVVEELSPRRSLHHAIRVRLDFLDLLQQRPRVKGGLEGDDLLDALAANGFGDSLQASELHAATRRLHKLAADVVGAMCVALLCCMASTHRSCTWL